MYVPNTEQHCNMQEDELHQYVYNISGLEEELSK